MHICNINFLVSISKSQGVVTEENSEELIKALISFISNISHYCNLLDTMERADRKTKAIGFTTSYSYVSFNLLVFGVNIIWANYMLIKQQKKILFYFLFLFFYNFDNVNN